MYLRLIHPVTGLEVLVNVATLPIIGVDYVDAAGNLLDRCTMQSLVPHNIEPITHLAEDAGNLQSSPEKLPHTD